MSDATDPAPDPKVLESTPRRICAGAAAILTVFVICYWCAGYAMNLSQTLLLAWLSHISIHSVLTPSWILAGIATPVLCTMIVAQGLMLAAQMSCVIVNNIWLKCAKG